MHPLHVNSEKQEHKFSPVNILGGLVGIGPGEVQKRASDALIEAATHVLVEAAQLTIYRGSSIEEKDQVRGREQPYFDIQQLRVNLAWVGGALPYRQL
jgi:hypothetical protein